MAEEMKVTDLRGSRRAAGGGIVVARGRADVEQALGRRESARAPGAIPTDRAEARRMGAVRVNNQKMAYGGGSNVNFAIQRPHDPMFYWTQNNMPYDVRKADDLVRIRALCRAIYSTHPLMSSAIDIYSKWPVVGAEFVCKDEALVDFYSTLFFDQLNYEEYLVDIGREYWTVGEAWPFGSFNEELGVWEDDELLNPDDVFVEKSPFLKEPRFFIRLPETLRKVIQTAQPRYQYEALMRSYPELKHFAGEHARMPVSNVLLTQLKFKVDTFNPRGIPIMMRALRSLVQEEMLNSAQDSIADRLYTPLILARLGASATDLGTTQPWVPTEDQIGEFEDALDIALAADFRVLTTHFAVQMDSVFGRETMPNFDPDFERLAEKELQTFGLSKTMLSGAGSGETYAADALNRDLVSQLLTTDQRNRQRFVKERCLVVAEAQEHYDYEVRGGRRYPVMEEVLVVDEESGEKKIIEQPKLLVPDLKLATMNMRDDESQRQFFEALRASGVPISMRTRLVNVPIDFDDEIEATREEQVDLAVEAQKTRKETYERLRAENLPIPEDLVRDFAPKPVDQGGNKVSQEPTRVPSLGVDDQDHAALAPSPEDLMTPPGIPNEPPLGQAGDVVDPGAAGAGGTVIPLPTNRMLPSAAAPEGRRRPMESDEARRSMPKASVKEVLRDEDGRITGQKEIEYETGIMVGPRHVGMRRFSGIGEKTDIGPAAAYDLDHAIVEPTEIRVASKNDPLVTEDPASVIANTRPPRRRRTE